MLLGGCNTTHTIPDSNPFVERLPDDELCEFATNTEGENVKWSEGYSWHIREAKRRGLLCGVGQTSTAYNYQKGIDAFTRQDYERANRYLKPLAVAGYARAQYNMGWIFQNGFGVEKNPSAAATWYEMAASQDHGEAAYLLASLYEYGLGVTQNYTEALKWYRVAVAQNVEFAAGDLKALEGGVQRRMNRQRLESSQNLVERGSAIAESPSSIAQPNKITEPKAEKKAKARSINQDSLRPTLQIIGKYSKDATGFIEGRVTDNVEVVELLVNGQPVVFGNDGRFTHQEYLPTGGKEFTIVAVDRAGLKTTETVRLNREAPKQVAKVSFDSLNPTTRRVKSNNNAIALIVGVAEYEKTAGAEYADRDAQVFYDYANLKLGIPRDRIQTLINDKADEVGLLSGINKWLKRSVKQGESDVYIFFAGHGLASDDGDTAYLIPYDGAPDFLERTAISRDEVFREVSSVNPRSVTVFLDTCYSGDTRGETRLIAGRPLSIKLQEQSLPAGFTVLTAAGGDQIAKPLKEAQHGLFSYFLMKGMEGGADANSDNQITARELHTYVRENVVQQSGGSQVPELQGDAERVLVRFR